MDVRIRFRVTLENECEKIREGEGNFFGEIRPKFGFLNLIIKPPRALTDAQVRVLLHNGMFGAKRQGKTV